MVSEVGDVVQASGVDYEVVGITEATRDAFGYDPARVGLRALADGMVEWMDVASCRLQVVVSRRGIKEYVRRTTARAAQKAADGDHDESWTPIVAPWKTGKAGRGDF